ncbi:sulfatase [Alienimonas californiensis]|uniref:Arylsulfatase n=1 Tax=Alienimonas californiensis TaxID=2527989 RepID=A0A517P6P9_9PLAN|nr:sulfatase [Alienimonas californiensis]QDT15022.1 Arylsulfatase [Alienimonas californiensis]
MTNAAPLALFLLAVLPVAASAAGPEPGAGGRPNVLFVLADDLGWRDLGCYGGPFETPALDRLAAQGVRFTQAYAPAPICSASRAAILTGRSPARLNFTFVTKPEPGRQSIPGMPLRTPLFTLHLPLEEVTTAEVLAAAGYDTAFFGKWHLNPHHKRYLGWHPEFGPPRQGFTTAVEDFGGHPYNSGRPAGPTPPGTFPDDSLTDRAVEFLTNRPADAAPFYLHVSHFYVHTPVDPRAEWAVEEARGEPGVGGNPRRARYAAFVQTLDHHVGRLLTALEASGHAENTLVIFFSDNGGHPEFARQAPLRGHKWTLYEGGIRVPLIVRGPGVPAGRTVDEPVIGTDLLPTLADYAGVDLADSPLLAGRPLDGVSVRGLFEADPAAIATARDTPRTTLWHFPYYHPETGVAFPTEPVGWNDPSAPFVGPHSAVRVGDRKAVYFWEDSSLALYDLAADPAERTDLAADDPALADRWKRRLFAALDAAGARRPVPADPTLVDPPNPSSP